MRKDILHNKIDILIIALKAWKIPKTISSTKSCWTIWRNVGSGDSYPLVQPKNVGLQIRISSTFIF